jgi:hypothetical protein
MAPTSEWFFVPILPRRSPEIVSVWTPGTLWVHKSLLRPRIGMTFKANLYLSLKAFQQCVTLYLHTPGSVDSRLLVVRNQIASLTPDPSFYHNLCWKCPNGSCEAIFDIYTSISFQWHEERLKARCLTPAIKLWSFKSPRGLPSPHFGSVSVIFTFFQKWGCDIRYVDNFLISVWGARPPCSK